MNTSHDPQSTCRMGIDSRQILLADGRYWGFALVSTRLSPIFETLKPGTRFEAIATSIKSRVGHSHQVELYQTLIKSKFNEASSLELWALFFTMASCLLQEAHEVDLEVCKTLLRVEHEELPRLVQQVLSVFNRASL
jgi:hypothetical protein